jgi:predicted phage terminase large subunit-like protein
VHLTAGVDSKGNVYVEDAWRERCDIGVTVEKHIDLCENMGIQMALIDDDNMAKVYVQLLATRCRARGIMVPLKMLPMRGQNKETRAAPLRGLFKSGKIFLKRAPWNRWLVNEILAFPNAMGDGVDDGIDALGLIGRRLASLGRPALPVQAAVPKLVQQATLNELWEDRERSSGLRRRI